MSRCIVLFLFCFCLAGSPAFAQVESYGRDQAEEAADTVNPADTVKIAPKFEGGDNDFLRYIETHFNATLYKGQLKPMGDMVQFEIYITKNGEVDEFQVLSSSNHSLDNEFKTILYTMPEWTPGKVGGKTKKIKMIYTLRVRSSDTPPYVQVDKENMSSQYDPSTKALKVFLITGSLLILATLFLIKK